MNKSTKPAATTTTTVTNDGETCFSWRHHSGAKSCSMGRRKRIIRRRRSYEERIRTGRHSITHCERTFFSPSLSYSFFLNFTTGPPLPLLQTIQGRESPIFIIYTLQAPGLLGRSSLRTKEARAQLGEECRYRFILYIHINSLSEILGVFGMTLRGAYNLKRFFSLALLSLSLSLYIFSSI